MRDAVASAQERRRDPGYLSPLAETTIRAVVFAALALPLAFGLLSAAVSAIYTPAEIATGAHWAAVGWATSGWAPPACAGCGMCGMSRAFAAVMHGDLAGAWSYNPMVVVVFPAVMTAMTAAAWAIVRFVREPLQFRSRMRATL